MGSTRQKKKAIPKAITAIFVIVLFAALSMSGTVYASPGTTYYVNAATGNDGNTGLAPGAAWKTITHAVNTAPAGASQADPNIIQVAAGLYDATNNGETFAITFNNSNINLTGAGAATTTIYGEGARTILDINATGITVEGFNFTNATSAIESDDAGGFTILNNLFTDVEDGVHLEIDEDDLASDYTVDAILIAGNTFNISSDGVYVYIDLDYNATLTGFSATIGDIDILDNVFNMGTTDGIDIDYIEVEDLNDGSISVGDVHISGNEFYDGDTGIDFYGEFYDLTNTTVTVGDVVINDNLFEDQDDEAIDMDYYDANYWYGTTTGTFGDLVINGNTITSGSGDAIYISDVGYCYEFYDLSSVTVGDLIIEGNEIDVSDYGVYIYYSSVYDLDNDAAVTIGEVSVVSNTISSGYEGISLEYDDVGYDVFGHTNTVLGDVHIEGNEINASEDAIYVYYEDVAYEMYGSATLLMGDTYIIDNEISSDDGNGLYIEYYEYYVGSYMEDSAYAELPSYIITGNNFDVEYDGIYFYTYSNPDDNCDYATLDFGGFFIDDNTFSCDYGINLYIEDVYEGTYDNTTTIIRDTTITNNEFYGLDDEAICIYYDDLGAYDYSTVDVGDLVIAGNVIDGASYGIDVEYYNIYSEADSMVTMGTLDITGNTISNVEYDGIYLYYDLYAYDDSFVNVGRALIQGNNIDGCGDDGIYLYRAIDTDTDAMVNLGNTVIDDNTIEDGNYGIYSEDGSITALKGGHKSDGDGTEVKRIKEPKIARDKTVKSPKEMSVTGIEGDAEVKKIKKPKIAKDKTVSTNSAGESELMVAMDDSIISMRNALYSDMSLMAVANAGDATISNNEISDNGHGIWVESSNNTIVRNMIARNTGNPDTGVHVDDHAENNEIHENCFYDNEPQAMDNGTDNDWDGNYWSDYPQQGVYDIDGTAGSKDNDTLRQCPLMPSIPVPDLTTIGILALVGSLSVLLSIRKKRG